ncbi:MAG: hypothetical protein E7471_03580 [Ruminococcaceae bacterium]|nr:hypothetical protein [Oscillospiraceae bacterium]
MALNHHVLAKATTDAILQNFKSAIWKYNGDCGADFYRVGTSADFPSPDAAFYDPKNKKLASFEFKPATETKRGMLTGVGQSIAYLKNCDLAYLISPHIIDGFNMGEFLTDVYENQIGNKVPVGLILYDNNNPNNLTLAHNVDELSTSKAVHIHKPTADRFWAKHQDLPIAMFHLLLHYYYLKKVGMFEGDAFSACWNERMIPENILDDFVVKPVKDISGNIIGTLQTNKPLTFLEKIIPAIQKKEPRDQWSVKLRHAIDATYIGDNYYNSIRKNYVTFLKHIQVVDSEGCLTDSGFNLYHVGLSNGPTSKLFVDYFTREVLTVGHHLDLLLDIDSISQKYPDKDIDEVLTILETEYELKGYIKRNPKRIAGDESKTGFLKYEKILWQSLGLMDSKYNISWKRITEICSLPEL